MDKKRERRERERDKKYLCSKQTPQLSHPPAPFAAGREAAAQRDGPEARPSLMGLIRREEVGGGDRQKRT